MDISRMESKIKSWNKLKFGICIKKILESNKAALELDSKQKTKHTKITSLRNLAASSGIEYSIIQKITTGKRNPQLTTIISIAEGLGISEVDLFNYFSNVTDQEIKNYVSSLKKTKSTLKKKKV